MPTPSRHLSPAEVETHIRDACSGPPSGRVGIEAEWFCHSLATPDEPAPFDTVSSASAGRLPSASLVSFEPGGQIELSTAPGLLGSTIAALSNDQRSIEHRFADAGLFLSAQGVDPREVPRVVDSPRYLAMEAYFASRWPDGLSMMRKTASVQINLDIDWDATTWKAINNLGVVMAAAFSNSPEDGWCSSRLGIWSRIDPSRTAPVPCTTDPASDWAEYAMDASVMFIANEEDFIPVLEPMTLRSWVKDGSAHGWPSLQDIDTHLSTLFPPIRPRGWAEIRVCDSLPGELWRVPVAFAYCLMNDDDARKLLVAMDAVAGRWDDAARLGLSDPVIGDACVQLFSLAQNLLGSAGADERTVAEFADFFGRYVRRGRSPADDVAAARKEASWT